MRERIPHGQVELPCLRSRESFSVGGTGEFEQTTCGCIVLTWKGRIEKHHEYYVDGHVNERIIDRGGVHLNSRPRHDVKTSHIKCTTVMVQYYRPYTIFES